MNKSFLFCVIFFFTYVSCDVYLHNPRGGNNRKSEKDENRTNNTRMFNSQNNAAGGTGVTNARYEYYKGSILSIQWSGYAGGLGEQTEEEYIIQYMCDTNLRDGTGSSTTRIDISAGQTETSDLTAGRHESVAYAQNCVTRARNSRLYYGNDQPNGSTAQYTRQNAGGTIYGTECAEEREYYPYWHPTPWKDIAYFGPTGSNSRCAEIVTQSNNVASYGECSDPQYNTQSSCSGGGGSWSTSTHGIAAPECFEVEDYRTNTGIYTYNWTIPDVTCPNGALRIRYNVSSYNILPFNTDVDDTTPAQLFEINPEVQIAGSGNGQALQLAINTAQVFRTFQDRTHTFSLVNQPGSVTGLGCTELWNLGIAGRRGNFVETFPSLEYYWAPQKLYIPPGSCANVQWQSTDAYDSSFPEGQGSNQDQHNFVQLSNNDPKSNFPEISSSQTLVPTGKYSGLATVSTSYSEILQFSEIATYHYFDSFNNAYSNRAVKGTIEVYNTTLPWCDCDPCPDPNDTSGCPDPCD